MDLNFNNAIVKQIAVVYRKDNDSIKMMTNSSVIVNFKCISMARLW